MLGAGLTHGGGAGDSGTSERSPMSSAHKPYMCQPPTRIFLVDAAQTRGGRGSE
jgi:hypothetical protein